MIYSGGGYKLVIFGCGGHARSIVNVIRETCEIDNVVLIDENIKDREVILGFRTQHEYRLGEKDAFIIAVGDNNKRKKIYQILERKREGHCISVASIYANIGVKAKIGQGVFIAPNAYVGPQAEIGDNVIINTGSIIEHETIIGNHTHIAPHATICGRSKIGSNVLCGAGSTIIDKISICDDVVIGAGAVVNKDIIESGIYVGVPAKRIS